MTHSLAMAGHQLRYPVPLSDTIEPAVDALVDATARLGGPGLTREPISPELRRLVFMRDGFTCRWCGNRATRRTEWDEIDDTQPAPFQLDHITPHAAGGCDHAHNLRVLCRWCNERRSNYATDQYARVLPVTLLCTPCQWGRTFAPWHTDWDDDDTARLTPASGRINAYCGTCRAASWVETEQGLL